MKVQVDVLMSLLSDPSSKNRPYQWGKTLMRVAAADGKDTDTEKYKNFLEKYGMDQEVERDEATEAAVDSFEEKTVFYTVFAVGEIVEKATTLNKDLLRVPAVLERKGCVSFNLTLEEDKDLYVSGDHSLEHYCTTDHDLFDLVDFMARGIHRVENDHTKVTKSMQTKDNLISRAKKQQPVLSRLTIFNCIYVPKSSDPLNGLYIGSNGYLATEVIQFRRLFGPWQEVGGMKDVSELELCDCVEAVNLTGDSVIPAGQVAFRAKVGEKYKLSPGIALENSFGAVARYKGKGRLAGFQDSKLVDVEILILREEHCSNGFGIGVLYSAPEYYFLKLYKPLRLQSFQDSN